MNEFENITSEDIQVYLERLTSRIFKILPLYEEESTTLDSYVDSLVRELIGNSKIIKPLKKELLTLSGTLKGIEFDSHKNVRSDIFKALEIIGKLKDGAC